ncbi:MAG: Ig-like domain-containing protein [Desulfatibacillaceae bacterium]|nr:Ig-like domain-containing protein [Desulfatibacillaceae bacterium]
MKSRIFLLFLALVLLQPAFFAFAAGDGTQIDRFLPNVAYDPVNQQYLAVYGFEEFQGGQTSELGIKGQLFDSKGRPMGEEFGIASDVLSGADVIHYRRPAVAFSASQQMYLVAWTDQRNQDSTDIFGQLVGADGTPYTPGFEPQPGIQNFTIARVEYAPLNQPDCAWDSINDRFLVVWEDYRDEVSDIYGQLITPQGLPYTTTVDVNFPVSNRQGNQEYPSVAFDSVNGRFLVVFDSAPSDMYMYPRLIMGQFISSEGQPYSTTTWENLVISNAVEFETFNRQGQLRPAVAFEPNTERYLAVWVDERTGEEGNQNRDIYGQIVDAEGHPYSTSTWENFPISVSNNKVWKFTPAIATDLGNSRFAVVWDEERNGDFDIYGQIVNNDGELLFYSADQNVMVAKGQPNNEEAPAIAYGESFLVAYGQSDNDWTFFDVGWVRTNDMLTSLMGHWPVTEGTGSTVHDISGYNNHATAYNNGWGSDIAGQPGQALYLNGSAWAQVPDAPAINMAGPFTVSVWVKPEDTMKDFTPRKIVAKSQGEGNFSWALEQHGSEVQFSLSDNGFDVTNQAIGNGLEPDRWSLVTGVWDGENIRVLINGVTVGGPAPFEGPLFQSEAPLTFGTGSGYFKGLIDDIRLYSVDLSDDQAAQAGGLTAEIYGYVKDGFYTFMPGVQVVAQNQNMEWQAFGVTDTMGNYSMRVFPGCYEVWVQGFNPSEYQVPPTQCVSAPEGASVWAEFTLMPDPLSISGRVTQQGVPVEGIEVFYHSNNNENTGTWTQWDGTYLLEGLPRGTGQVGVKPEPYTGLAPDAIAVSLTASLTNVDFALDQGATLEGLVLDVFNNPLSGIMVEALNDRVDVDRQAMTGPDGVFVIEGIAPGKTGVVAHADRGRMLSGSPERTVYLASGEHKVIAPLVMQPGTIVYGAIFDPYYATPINCAGVFSLGTNFTANSNVCGGMWAMVMPQGEHRVFLEPEDEQGLPFPMAACPVDVMIMQEDVANSTTVMAPPMSVQTGGGSSVWFSVTVPENTTWVDPPGGRPLALAYPAGTFGYPITPDALTRIEPSNGVELLAPDTPYQITPICPGDYDIYLVWAFDDPYGPESYTILSVASVSAPLYGGEIPVYLELPEVFAPQVTGQVLDSYGAAIAGAWVLVTDDAGSFAGYAMTDEAGCYTFVNMPAPADPAIFEAQAAVPGLVGNPVVQFNIQTGQDAFVPDLVFQAQNFAGVSIYQTFTVGTTDDSWDNWDTPVPGHVHYGVYWAAPPMSFAEILSPSVVFTPGFAVENVFGRLQINAEGFTAEELFEPDWADNPNTELAQYHWMNLPDWDSPEKKAGFFAVDSTQTALAVPFTITRTVTNAPQAGQYTRWINLEVEVHEPGIDKLHLDIFDLPAPIAEAMFDPGEPGRDGEGQPVDNEYYDYDGNFVRHTINSPNMGEVYQYSKLIIINPVNNQNPVDYMSRTRVRAEYDPEPAQHLVNGGTLTIDEPGNSGIVITPANPVEWMSPLITKTLIMEVVQDAFVSEQNAQRPIILTPQPQNINHPVDAPLVIEFSKSMHPESFFFRAWDQWGNVIFDSVRGPYNASISWSSAALADDRVTIEFWEDLAPGLAYTVAVQARDSAGYSLGPFASTWSFSTAPQAGDTVSPSVMAGIPYDGAQGVPAASPRAFQSAWIMAVFSEAVRPDTIDGIELLLLDGPGGSPVGDPVACNRQWSGSRVALLPHAPLNYNSWYRVVVPTSVLDLSGNTLVDSLSWEFETGNAPEAGFELAFELDGANRVDRKSTALVFTSSRDIDPATLIPGNVSIFDSAQDDITGFFDINYLSPTRGIRLTPKPEYAYAALEPGETYTVRFSADVKDTYGVFPFDAPKEFSFTTALPHANMRPQIWSLGDMPFPLPPYPYIMTTPEILYYDMIIYTSDPDALWPGENLEATGQIGIDTFDFDDASGMGWFFTYQTVLMPPGEGAAPGEYEFSFTLTDSAGNQATASHPVIIFNGTPQLVDPPDGAFTAWPPVVSWQPVPDARAYIVEVCTDETCEQVIGSFLLPDDQRMEDYSITLPEDLPYPGGNMAWWQVIALASVDDSNAPWGGAVSPVRQVLADVLGPMMAPIEPFDGQENVEPGVAINVMLTDYNSGIDLSSIQMFVNSLPVPGAELFIDDMDPHHVNVTWEHPNLSFSAGMLYTVRLVCRDMAGNPLQQPDSFAFTVRENAVLEVPFAFGTIQEAADSATAGDTILIEQNEYWQDTVLGPQHSGISIQGSGVRETVVRGTGAAASVFTLEGASNVTISDLTIEGGAAGGVYIVEVEGFPAVGNLVERAIIRSNGPFGVAIEAGGENFIENCLIAQNVIGVAVKRSTVAGAQDPAPWLISNTIVESGADGIFIENASPKIHYNIVANNSGFGMADYSNSPVLGYNNIFNNTLGNYFGVAPGAGDISVDPLYPGGAEPQPWPWLPGAASQVIDALPATPPIGQPGYPAEDLRGVLRPQGLSPDMGCYENSETPTPPAPVDDVGGEYMAMEGRPISVAFSSVSEYPGGISFGFALAPPEGMSFVQPMPGQSPGYLTWTPAAGHVYGAYEISPQVSTAGGQVVGEPVTINVVPALKLTPSRSTALILGAGQERETAPIYCMVSGGTPPYSVVLINGDGTVAQIDGLVEGETQGPFTLLPLSATPVEDNPVYIRVTDSSFMPGFAAAPQSFELVSGAFGVNQVYLTYMADLFVNPLQDETIVVEDGLLTGMTIDIPAGSLAAGVTITVYEVTGGAPHIGGASPAVVNFSPDGAEFALPVSVLFPVPPEFEYGPGRTINDLVALYFDVELGRWQFVPIVVVDAPNQTVTFDTNHFSLYTLALPEFVGTTFEPGTEVSDYRMVCFPVNPAANDSVRGLLADPANFGAYDDRYWRLFAFDAAAFATGDPNLYYVEATAIDFDERFPLSPAQAFWAISRNGGPVSIPGLTADNAADFQTTLVPGWNMIGNPYTDRFVDFTKVLTFDGENWYLQSNVADINNPLRNETLYEYNGLGAYQATMLMAPNTAYWVYNNASAPVTLKIPVDALTAQAGEKAKTTWFARLVERGSKLITGAMADAVVRQPPLPPGSGGSNPGTSADSIGVHTSSASGGGFCFVRAASDSKGIGQPSLLAAFTLALLAALGALAAFRNSAAR